MSLKDYVRPALTSLTRWGIDPRQAVWRSQELGRVRADRKELLRQGDSTGGTTLFPMGRAYVITGERTAEAGEASGHYFHQDLLVARDIFRSNPRRHIDVGSRVDGFVAHVAAFRDIEVCDIRPITTPVEGITFHHMDLMSMSDEWFGVADSVSCLHALEHFGLGRYGDLVDFDGWRKGLDNLRDLLEPGGTLYLSVPTGMQQRIEFNAHRIFSLPFLKKTVSNDFDILQVDFVLDDGSLSTKIDLDSHAAQRSFDAKYACSIWKLQKK
jgi:SAM-dependent methyltransferase